MREKCWGSARVGRERSIRKSRITG